MVAALKGNGLPSEADFHEAISTRGDSWYSACLKITRSADLAEDAVQDALLNAWRKREQFTGAARLDTWIHRIAINAALQLVRRQKPGAFEPLDAEVADDRPTPETIQSDFELEGNLSLALEYLSDIERVCFVLKHLEQWRLREIADELGTSVNTIKQALFRGVRKLRTRMPGLTATVNGDRR